jgi:ssRNA-specific RNase YbeY (16S rRNA maturation enzyme)
MLTVRRTTQILRFKVNFIVINDGTKKTNVTMKTLAAQLVARKKKKAMEPKKRLSIRMISLARLHALRARVRGASCVGVS